MDVTVCWKLGQSLRWKYGVPHCSSNCISGCFHNGLTIGTQIRYPLFGWESQSNTRRRIIQILTSYQTTLPDEQRHLIGPLPLLNSKLLSLKLHSEHEDISMICPTTSRLRGRHRSQWSSQSTIHSREYELICIQSTIPSWECWLTFPMNSILRITGGMVWVSPRLQLLRYIFKD